MDRIDFRREFNENLPLLIELLRIPSIYDENTASETMPYGQNVYKAFDYMRRLALKDGFIVKEYRNEALSISYIDKEEQRIDIASHLDVVSVDDSWSIDPFKAIIKDSRLYARGASDMKTALFLTYIALKLLRRNYPNTYNEIRLVFGSDEERTMHDMWTYKSMVKEPLFAFSPDGKFPMAIGEKGALMWTIDGSYSGIIESLRGGIQCNIVAPNCTVILKDVKKINEINDYIEKNRMNANAELIEGKIHLSVEGVACHCSRNWEGKNAIILALKIIRDIYQDSIADSLVFCLEDNFGKGIDGYSGSDFETCMTVNLGILNIQNGKIKGQIDARYPSGITSELLTNNLKKKCAVPVSLDYDDPPTLCRKEDPYIQTLLDTYREITGDSSEPRISGGVSYSKVFKHCVTFGMTSVNGPYLAHEKDEYVEIEECIQALEIYYKTMERLAFLEVKE